MKKFVIVLLSIVILMSYINVGAFATTNPTESNSNSSIIYLNDGSYIVITMIQCSDFSRAANTKTGKKTITYYGGDDEIQWTATLLGTFSYNGSSATCTNATISYSINNSIWDITTANASKSNNKAIGNVTAKRYFLGVPVQTVEQTTTITCSANGTLS